MSTILPLPLQATVLSKAIKKVYQFFKTDEFPEQAVILIKKAGNPIFVYDQANQAVVGLVPGAVTIATPLTVTTVTGSDLFPEELIEIEPAGTIAALTVNLEATANVPVGAVKRLAFSQIVTALTVQASGAATGGGNGTINGAALAAAAVNTSVGYQKIGTNTWRRLY
jgi:hypothetical protein